MNRKHFDYIFGNICRVQKQLANPMAANRGLWKSALLCRIVSQGIQWHYVESNHRVSSSDAYDWSHGFLPQLPPLWPTLRTSSCIARVPQTKWPVCQVLYTARTSAGLSQSPFSLLPLLLPTKVHLLPPPTSFVQERCWGVCSCHCTLWADPPLWNAQN